MEFLRRVGCLGVFGLIGVVAAASFQPALRAQDDDDHFSRGSLGLLKVSDPESRTFLQDLRHAREAIREERYDDALAYLGDLITGDPEKATDQKPVMTEDFFLINRDGELFTSIKTEALRLLDSIPAKALKQYELAHGTEAQALFDEALTTGDAEKLAEVMRRFFHTTAGYRACLALGRLNLEQGRPLAAASYLKRLAGTPAAQKETEPEASLLLAGAQLHAGQTELAQQTLLALKQRQPNFTVRGAASPAWTNAEEARDWLEKLFGRPQSGDAPTAHQWTMFRGSVDRNAITSFAELTSSPRWRVPVANDPNDEQIIADAARSYQQQGIAALPSIQPLAVRNVVIMRGPDRLVAIDVASGKRIWEPAMRSSAQRELRNLGGPNALQARPGQLRQRVWDDAPLGQLSSDGELVFYVEGLGDAVSYGSTPYNVGRFQREKNPDAQPATNMIVALSLKKEGSEVWYTPSRGDLDPLNQALFLGAPLPLNGQLYVIAEIRGELSLVTLDAATGEFKWKQQIGHAENLTVLADPLRRMTGASPSYADGILICPTTAGAVVAIDVATRRLLWGSEYSHDQTRVARYDGAYAKFPKFGDRWIDSSVTIAEGKVILTPPDSPELHCLDLTTGKAVWPAQRREELLFVAGVHEGVIVLVGKSQITGIKLADGQRAWDDIPIDLPSGRGVLDKSFYYQPTTAGKLLAIDVSKGEVKDEFATTKPLGNLVTYGDDIISVTAETLSAYPRIDRLEHKIEQALSRDPQDPWALARSGELLLHQRKWNEALSVLRQAHAQARPDPAVATLLVTTILALLEDDYAKNEALSEEAEKLIDDPLLRNRYYRLSALGREQKGDRVGAFRAFLAVAVSSQPGGEVIAAARQPLIDLDAHWRTRNDRWIAAHLAALYQAANDTEREQLNEIVASAYAAISKNAPGGLRAFAERFAFHRLAAEAQLDLAKLLMASNNLLEAESLVRELAQAADRRVAGRALLLSTKILQLANRWPEAVRRSERLATEFASVELQPGHTGKQMHEGLAKQYEYRQALALADKSFARGRAVIEVDTRNTIRNAGDMRRAYQPLLLQAETGGDPRPIVTFEPLQGVQNTLRVRDSLGHDVTTVNLNRSDTRRFYGANAAQPTARLAGHLLLVSTGQELIAIDLLRSGRDSNELILWRQDLLDSTEQSPIMGQSRGIANPWAVTRSLPTDGSNRLLGVFSPITSAGTCYVKQKELRCVDPFTGETNWLRSDAEPGSDLFGDEEYLFVAAGNGDEADVYHMRDGSPAGKRKVVGLEQRWATSGRRVLSWSLSGKGMHLQLDDVWAEKTIWSELAPNGSKAWMCSPTEVGILSTDGKFKVRSLDSETVKVEAQLEKDRAIQQLYVLKSSRQYFVAVAVPPTHPITNPILQGAPGGTSPLFTGKLYAFDAATGKPSWPAPAAISQFGLPLDQPLDQPVLLFLNNIIPRTGQGSQKSLTAALCLDKRTGAVVWEDHDIPGDSKSYELVTERDLSAVRVTVPGRSVRIRFTEEPAPPEPPVQLDQAFLGKSTMMGLFKRAVQPKVTEPNFDFSDP